MSSQATATQTQPSAAQATPVNRDKIVNPLENLTLAETLRVMDVAREMRERRETAEEMFRRDDLRSALRDKLLRQARMSGEKVTEAEIEAAIRQYMETLHVYQDPPAGLKNVLAHAWVYRVQIFLASAATALAAGGLWYFFA
jgi:Family of unknown function (DUF6384)